MKAEELVSLSSSVVYKRLTKNLGGFYCKKVFHSVVYLLLFVIMKFVFVLFLSV